ncbi:MAG TPA: LPS assembly lipoprotein LptE [Gemmatimonadaceae bacterium]
MSPRRSIPRSGRADGARRTPARPPRRVATLLLAALLLATGACAYGFAGGGLPPHIKSMAIVPFENETAAPELQAELFEVLRTQLRSRLGVQDAGPERADALVRGTIKAYDLDVPAAISADPGRVSASRRRLQLTIDVEIVDQSNGRVIWSKTGLRAEGEYAERQEAAGRRMALERIVNDIVEGAQSQW